MEEKFESIIHGIMERGFGILDDFLSQDEIVSLSHSLKEQYQASMFKAAGIGNHQNYTQLKGIRGDHIHWIAPSTVIKSELHFLRTISEFMAYLNRTCYTGLRDFECHYALYPPGTFYKKHLDQFKNDDRRKYTLICYLNQDWQEADGGHLLLYQKGQQTQVFPKAGRLVCFESAKIPHEVRTVQRERMSITGWLKS